MFHLPVNIPYISFAFTLLQLVSPPLHTTTVPLRLHFLSNVAHYIGEDSSCSPPHRLLQAEQAPVSQPLSALVLGSSPGPAQRDGRNAVRCDTSSSGILHFGQVEATVKTQPEKMTKQPQSQISEVMESKSP